MDEDPESFVGPGKYNVGETYTKLTLRPCSTVIKRISVLPKAESGRPCYYLVGQNLKYEQSFLDTHQRRRQEMSFGNGSLHSTLSRESISRLKRYTDRTFDGNF